MLHYRAITNEQFNNWVVMIHGAGGSIEVWYRQVADFARHFNVLLVDLVGHGGSAGKAIVDGFNFSNAADQVMEVVNHLKIEKCHFMGLSLGSIVVRFIAQKHPQRVLSMVLAGAVTKISLRLKALLHLTTTFKNVVPYRILRNIFAKFIIPQPKYSKSKSMFLSSAEKMPFESFTSWLKLSNGLAARVKSLFEEHVSIPTLYVMGEDDKLFLKHVRRTVSNSPGDNVSLAIVPNAGHVCNIDNKSYFNQLSIDFIERVSRGIAC
jgi:pimeloyl-ACP methyl ester carboxylesterase